ncbi:MAG: prenyltransferase [Planctomycetes bacterium]|nr:prenyltransferase [Planctomycetota bacterium]
MNAGDLVAGRTSLKVWFRAVRAFSFTASLTPVLLGAVLALGAHDVRWELTPLVAMASVLIHAGTNLVSDAADYRRGVDRPGTHGGSGVLVAGLLTAGQVFFGGLVLLAAGSVVGLFLVWARGLTVLWLGLAGVAGGFLYGGRSFGYKYIALGDVMVFLLMGPLIVVGAHFTLTGEMSLRPLLASLPVACLVTAILYSNNLRDIAHDCSSGVRTLAGMLGLRGAKIGYFILVGGAYALAAAWAACGVLSPWTLLVLLTLPPAWKNLSLIRRARMSNSSEIAAIDVLTAQLHLGFGLLLSAGILLGAAA